MTGNTGLDTILDSFLQWVSIIGSMVLLVLSVTLLASFAAKGLSGIKSVLGFIFHGPAARLGGKTGVVLGVLFGGAVGWFTGPYTISQLSRDFGWELAQFGETSSAMIGLVFCALLGLVVGPVMCAAVFDSFHSSPRRIWSLAVLSIKESWARKLIWIFAVFVVLFMFFSWFSDSGVTRADILVKNTISTALFPITWLPLMVLMLLSCWGLPEDIKNRTIHTVVTKPVRRSEIFLGRILGFTCVGTFLLVVMGGWGYVWIMRQVPKKAQDERLICRVPIYGNLQFTDRNGVPAAGINVGDEDESRMYIEGGTRSRATWTFRNITSDRLGERLTLESRLRAFRLTKGDMERPLLGQMRFVRRLRERTALSIGRAEEFNEVRQSIEAGEFAEAANALSAIADVLENNPELPRLSLYRINHGFEAFAKILEPFHQVKPKSEWIGALITAAREVSKQGAEERTIELAAPMKRLSNLIRENAGELEQLLVDAVAEPDIFEVQEFGENVIEVRRNISYQVGDQQSRSGDLFSDFVHGGELQVEVMCLDTGQFLGMAHPDLFFHAKVNSFAVGYSKTLFGIWLMMILIIIIGVTSSCLVKGPVAILLTLTLLVVGSFFHGFLERIVQGEIKGGGAIESGVRIIGHLNPVTKLPDSNTTKAMQSADKTLGWSLELLHMIVPNFNKFRMSEWIVEGFDVPWIGEKSALIPGMLMALAYLFPCVVIGSYSLKLRELESK